MKSSGELSGMELSRENGLLNREQLRGVRQIRSGKKVLVKPRILLD